MNRLNYAAPLPSNHHLSVGRQSRVLQTSVSKNDGELIDKVQPDLSTEAVEIHDQVFP